jgi:NADPH-dependent 2,4-dienoyl-CoA reductase/sulfur reductase-like enzyme
MPAETDRIVVVGASVAGMRAAQALRSAGHDGELVVLGAEPDAPYDKPPLSKQLLTGEWTAERIGLAAPGDDFAVRLGAAASGLDVARRHVWLGSGERLDYAHLVIATGVRPRTLPTSREDCGGSSAVRTVRELGDAAALRFRLAGGGPVVVVGGGFVGAEVAAAAAGLGCPVTVVEALPAPFSRVLGPAVGQLLTRLHTEHGVRVLAGVGVAGIVERPDDTAVVRLGDGRELAAATVVVGVGCVPNTEWLAESGLPLADGVVTDQHGAVPGAPGVHAIGDVAAWPDPETGAPRRVEHWTSAVERAGIVAHNIRHPTDRRTHRAAPYFWSDQHGLKIQMVGRISERDEVEVLAATVPAGERSVALYSRAGRFTAAVTFGWPRGSVAARQCWERGADVAEVRARIKELASGVRAVDLAELSAKKGV